MKLGVVAALRTEIKPTITALPFPSAAFLFTVSGVGAARAEAAARALPADLDGLLSVGFCGALTDDLTPGDLLLGGSIGFDASPDLRELARRTPHRPGTVAMVEHVVVSTEEKRQIAGRTGALAVDMESAAVGRVALERKQRFLCVKVVLDTPSQPLASTYASGGRVLLDILKRPWIIGRMFGDGKRAKMAAGKLRDFFVAFAKELNP